MKVAQTFVIWVCLLTLSNAAIAQTDAFIDAHSHYEGEYSQHFTPQDVLATLDQQGVERILITAKPNDLTQTLFSLYPDRIIPFLSVYRTGEDKSRWMFDDSIPSLINTELDRFEYRGIGELHIFSQNKASPVFEEIIRIAKSKDLPLLVHGDAEVIEHLYWINPKASVLWAHMGTEPNPAKLDDLLTRHPQLHIDTSVREGMLLGTQQVNGISDKQLTDEWRHFFIKHQDRILAAVDTFSAHRWTRYGEVMEQMNLWLSQLPETVQQKVRFKNARRFFKL